MKARENKPRTAFNFIDYLILFAVLLSAIGIGVRIFTIENGTVPTDERLVSFRVDGVLPEVAYAIAEEKTLTLGGRYMATVESLTVTPSPIAVARDDRLLYEPSNLTCRIEGVLRVAGTETENGFFLDGKMYFVPGVSTDATGEISAFPLTVIAFLA